MLRELEGLTGSTIPINGGKISTPLTPNSLKFLEWGKRTCINHLDPTLVSGGPGFRKRAEFRRGDEESPDLWLADY